MNAEILAPAKDFDCLRGACLYGANAVYIGLDAFSMRSTRGFDFDNLAAAVAYARERGVRLYITLNTTPKADEIAALPEYLAAIKNAGAAAVICGDVGVLSLAARAGLEVHASVQSGVANAEAARVLSDLGASRVVLARELTLTQIAQIYAKIPRELELEAFVHGAVCMAQSGRCNISAYLTGRDANSGQCAQPCRWNFRTYLEEEKRVGQRFEVVPREDYIELLSSGDLCMIDHLGEMRAAGVRSLKIEGRAKSYYYVCTVTNAYANAEKPWARREVELVSHREYDTGFYFGMPPVHETGNNECYVRKAEIAGVVLSADGELLTLSQRNNFKAGDTLELLTPSEPPQKIAAEKLFDSEMREIPAAAHAKMTVKIPFSGAAVEGSVLRKTY